MVHDDWLGLPIADPAGRRFGRLDELFVGRTSGRPEFGIVVLGDEAEGGRERIAVPLHGATRRADALELPIDAERVHSAPRVQAEVDEIPAEAGRLILEHFGLDPDPAEATTSAMPPVAGPRDAGADEDVELIRSEEQLAVETRSRATERVRVRKAVTTEDVTVTVTLRREELIIEREPLAADAGTPVSDLAFTGEEVVDFVLHAEEPVVTKRAVPVERVRLRRNTIVEQERITDTVRKEHVEVDEAPMTREDRP